jgi:methyltransferase
MVMDIAFVVLLLGLGAQRLWECRVSLRHERKLRAWGAVEHAHAQVFPMVALHVVWFVAMPLEVFWLRAQASPLLFAVALALFTLGQVLRLRAMHALGVYWTIKVLTLPGAQAVSSGPFRRIRHPNYLGVWLETVSLPLVHGAFFTSALFGALQALFLGLRIRAEEAALRASTDYAAELDLRPRFIPRMNSHGQM